MYIYTKLVIVFNGGDGDSNVKKNEFVFLLKILNVTTCMSKIGRKYIDIVSMYSFKS